MGYTGSTPREEDLPVSQLEKSSVAEMIGEFLRELAVLIFVFVPLELWGGLHGNPREFLEILLWTVLIAIVSLTAGITLERVRP